MRSHLDKKKSSFLFSPSLVFSFFWSCIDLVLLRRLLEIGRLVRRSSSTTRTKLNLLIWQNDRCWSTMWNKASGLRPCHLVLFCVSVCSGSSLKTCKLAWCFMKPHKRCSWSIVINIFFSVAMIIMLRGLFINYVSRCCGFLDLPPPQYKEKSSMF